MLRPAGVVAGHAFCMPGVPGSNPRLFFINICVCNIEGYCLAFFIALELIEAKMYDFEQKCW